MKKYDHLKERLIHLFCSDDDLKPKLMHPNDYENFWCITDGHIAILIPHDVMSGCGISDLNYSNVFPPEIADQKLYTLEAFKSSLSEIKNEIAYDYSYIDCSCVSGCKKCDYEGTRSIRGKKNGLRYFPPGDLQTQYIKLGEGYFDPNYIYKVTFIMELLGLNLSMIKMIANSRNGATVLNISEVLIMIMPRQTYENPEIAGEIL